MTDSLKTIFAYVNSTVLNIAILYNVLMFRRMEQDDEEIRIIETY